MYKISRTKGNIGYARIYKSIWKDYMHLMWHTLEYKMHNESF